MNTSSIVLKIPKNEKIFGRYIPLSSVVWKIGGNNIIDSCWEAGDYFNDTIYYSIEAIDGKTINIKDLNCKSYAELIVALDLVNANHNVADSKSQSF